MNKILFKVCDIKKYFLGHAQKTIFCELLGPEAVFAFTKKGLTITHKTDSILFEVKLVFPIYLNKEVIRLLINPCKFYHFIVPIINSESTRSSERAGLAGSNKNSNVYLEIQE